MATEPKHAAPFEGRVSRRNFFGRCSAAAGYAVTGGVALAAELAADQGHDRPVRVTILGMGHRGTSLAETLRKTPGTVLTGWFEPCEEAARKAFARFAASADQPDPVVFADEDEALGSPMVDAVIISGPSDTHHGQILKAIEARKHILTEKPAGFGELALNSVEKALSSDFDRVFAIGLARKFHPQRARLMGWLAEGHLGQMVDIRADWAQPLGSPRGRDDWMTDPARTGDWVAEHGDHIWNMLADLRPAMAMPRVLHASRISGPVGDSAWFKASLAWADGVTADIRHSFLPGGQFASPGLSIFVQYRGGIVDLIQGRVNCERKLMPPEPFDKSVSEDSAMLRAFVGRIRGAGQTGDERRLANLEEIQRSKFVERLRYEIVTAFEA